MTSQIQANMIPHVVLDANVLFPFTLRDTFLRLADANYNNLKDFKHLPTGIEAQSPDNFLLTLFHDRPHEIINILREQAADMKRPPVQFDQLLQGLAKTVPIFVDAVCGLSQTNL